MYQVDVMHDQNARPAPRLDADSGAYVKFAARPFYLTSYTVVLLDVTVSVVRESDVAGPIARTYQELAIEELISRQHHS